MASALPAATIRAASLVLSMGEAHQDALTSGRRLADAARQASAPAHVTAGASPPDRPTEPEPPRGSSPLNRPVDQDDRADLGVGLFDRRPSETNPSVSEAARRGVTRRLPHRSSVAVLSLRDVRVERKRSSTDLAWPILAKGATTVNRLCGKRVAVARLNQQLVVGRADVAPQHTGL